MEPWLTRAARVHGARTAIRTADGAEVAYAELHERALSVAGALQARRVAPGDHVALALPSLDLVVALHACLLLGVVAVPIDLRLTLGPLQRGAHDPTIRLSDAEVWRAARTWLNQHDAIDTKYRKPRTAPLNAVAWRALWRPYWLSKRCFPEWLPLAPSRAALRALS